MTGCGSAPILDAALSTRPRLERNAILILGRSGALSGGDIHSLRLAEAWSRLQGSEVTLIGDSGLGEFIHDAPDLKLTPIATPFDDRMAGNAIALALGLAWRNSAAMLRCRGMDRVVAGSHLIFDVLPAVVARLLFGVRVYTFVYHIIGDMNDLAGAGPRLAQRLESVSLWLLRASGATTFVDNEEVRRGLIERGHRPDLLFDTTNAYDPAFELPDHVPADPPRLVFVGRLVEQKGIEDVLEVGRRLQQSGSDWQIDLVGDGPERPRLESEIARDRLVNVHLHGFVREHEKWAILAGATLFLAPSREEGWGIAVGEALLIGVPVIALDLPAYRHFPVALERVPTGGSEYVDRVLEFVNDPDRTADATQQLLNAASLLPRWTDVVREDLSVLTRAPEQE